MSVQQVPDTASSQEAPSPEITESTATAAKIYLAFMFR